MIHPLTPREKVAELIYDRLGMGSENSSVEQVSADIVAALASGSGDHAELTRLADDVRNSTALMASTASVRMDVWQDHSTAALKSADAIEALTAEVAALRGAKWEVQHVDTMNDMVLMGMARDDAEARATEAERKLAEADGLLIELADAPQPKDTGGRFFRAMSSINAYVARLNAGKLSKEAERG